jgi:hypothetical protein
MQDLFAADGVLLVGECERGLSDKASRGLVIQRSVRGGNQAGAEGESDVLEAEGLRAAFAVAVEVFGGAEEPEETEDAEVKGVPVGPAMDFMGEVQAVLEVADDGDVCRIRASAWVVGVAEGLEERSE